VPTPDPIETPVRLAAWSPDGKQIAWYTGFRFWIANKDGSHGHVFAKPVDGDCCGSLSWPRPKTLVYNDDFRVFELDTAGRTSDELVVLGFYLWTDRHGTVGATESPRGPFPLQLIGLAPTRWTRSISHGGKLVLDQDPTFSPDGRRVAFARSVCKSDDGPCTSTGIWQTRTGGGPVTPLVGEGRCPSWSPDGKRVLFFDRRGAFRTVRPAGGKTALVLRNVVADPMFSFPCQQEGEVPLWSPDGKFVAYVIPGSRYTLRLLSVGKRREREFARFGDVWQYAWSPVHAELLVVGTPPGGGPQCNSLWLLDATNGKVRTLHRCPTKPPTHIDFAPSLSP
jgi:Tol biopolymer transport system component